MCFAPQRRAIFWHQTSKKWSVPILTYKYASRHSRVPFFNSVTSKMAPTPSVFLHFHLQMCFAPQPTCHFSTSELQEWLRPWGVFTFWLANALRATAACHFSTSELQKWLRPWGVLRILTCKCAARHSGVPFLNSYRRTRRFSEATFRTSGTTNHWKNIAIRNVPNIFHTCTFFLVTRRACVSTFCWLDISSLLNTSTLPFNSAYCRKLDF